MNQKKLSFESENLVVDYISFKFQKLDSFTLKEIAFYLFEIGFNSYSVSGRLAKPIKESILVDPKNRYEVLFVIDNSYWEGTKLDFSGLNAQKSIDIHFLYQSLDVIQELDSKQHKIRSLRGFFLYACSLCSLGADRFGRNYRKRTRL